jgi:AcrR family transcriptional regulator
MVEPSICTLYRYDMPIDQNSVKIPARTYHHGALREALLAAAEHVLEERGVDGFSLRETARRAGVSPSAPAHHFRDTKGLLTALAASAFRELSERLESAAAKGTRDVRVKAQGHAYVRFALARPAKFDLMWRAALLDHTDAELSEEGARAFRALDEAVRGVEEAGRDPKGPGAIPSIACWSVVHGFAHLALDGAFGVESGDAERAADAMLAGVLAHLKV